MDTDTVTVTSVESRLMAAIARAVARSHGAHPGWRVCIKSPDGDTMVRLEFGDYETVSWLARELRSLGYQLEILHPEHMACDFVLKVA